MTLGKITVTAGRPGGRAAPPVVQPASLLDRELAAARDSIAYRVFKGVEHPLWTSALLDCYAADPVGTHKIITRLARLLEKARPREE